MTSSARVLRQPGQDDDEQLAGLLGVGFALSPLPAILLDDGLIITAANRSAELALGSGPQSLLGRCITDLIAPKKSAQSTPAAALGAGDHLHQELELVTGSAERMIAELSADAVYNHASPRRGRGRAVAHPQLARRGNDDRADAADDGWTIMSELASESKSPSIGSTPRSGVER